MTRLLLCAAIALVPLAAHAQPITVNELDDLFGTDPLVEVNLRGSLLKIASEAASGESPELSAMIEGLRGITVRVYPAPPEERDLTIDRFSRVADQFERQGWFTLIRVRSVPGDDEDGDVWIYVQEDGDLFNGMAVLAIDEDENNASFVWIDGQIDPANVGALSQRYARIEL